MLLNTNFSSCLCIFIKHVKQKQKTTRQKQSPNPCKQNPKINILPCFVIPTLCVRPLGTWPTLIEPPSKENNGQNIDAISRNCVVIRLSFISTSVDTVCWCQKYRPSSQIIGWGEGWNRKQKFQTKMQTFMSSA